MIARTFAAALFASALFAADAPLPVLRVEPVSGGSIFFVKNPHSQPLTGFLIELVDYPGSSYSYWQDDVANPVAPGAELRIPVANMTVGAVPDYVKLLAAVYADGGTAGIPARVQQLISRRRAILDTTRELISRIEKSEDLKPWADSLQPTGKPNRNSPAFINQSASRALILDTIGKLKSSSPAAVLQQLRASESALAQSRPVL